MLPEYTALIGLRNLDAREMEMVRDSRVRVFTMTDIARSGIAAVVEGNPILHDRNTTAILGVELAPSALGKKVI